MENDRLIIKRQGDTGTEVIVLGTPCLVTCSNDMNDPRIPNLKGIMGAKRKPIDVREARIPADVELPVVHVRRHEATPEREPGRILEGDAAEAVAELVTLLRTEANVL